jgi:hypothetical protein
MKTRPLFLLLILLFILPVASSAQVGLLRRAIDRQIGQKVDSAVEKSAKDNARQNEQANQSDQGAQGTGKTNRGLFGGKIDIKYEEKYDFTGRIYMQAEAYDKKDVVKSDYYTYFSNAVMNAGIEVTVENPKEKEKSVPTVFVFDGNNRAMMILMDNGESKTGIISSIPSDSALAAQAKTQQEKNTPPSVTKTGNTKVIAGYKCDEYKVIETEKDGYSLVWMTKDVKVKADKTFWGKAGMPTYYNYPGFEGAMMLASESYDENNKLGLKIETREINENFPHSITTTGYTFMKMNFGQAGKK